MAEIDIKIEYDKLKKAIQKHPEVMASETKAFLYRAGIRLESKAGSSPWRVGGSGGGVPVLTGNLLKSHTKEQMPFSLRYYQDDRKADYGKYVHAGRPWMVWVKNQAEKQIQEDAKTFLTNITNALGK
jgi:hypothetical protein